MKDIKVRHLERSELAISDSQMEACFILIANRRVLVEAIQQFRDQSDEEKIHRGDYQETCFVAHT